MCNCLTKVTKQTQEHLKKGILEKYPGSVVDNGEFQNAAMQFAEKKSDGTNRFVGFRFELTYRKKKKDGQLHASKSTTSVLIKPTYCGFCGEKLK